MLIIDKDDLDKYRLAVAKVSFLKSYDNYEFVEDISKTNCFIVYDNKEKYKKLISILWKPMVDVKKYDMPVTVYYQKRYSKSNNSYKTELLSEHFNELFSSDLNKALYSAMLYYKENEKYQIILKDLYFDANIAKDTSGFLCKYYSEEIYSCDKHKRVDGKVSFLNPNKFNDPFDCNCMSASGKTISDKFRVLCSSDDYQNILMWSYYCNEHKGYCLKYKKHDIIAAILSMKIEGLCIIGKVDYEPNRPVYKAKGVASYSDLKFWIDCTFTKFINWEHENEYRFVLLSDDFADGGIATDIQIPIVEYYSGCECDSTKLVLTDSAKNPHKTVKLQKDLNDYKLN